MYLRDLAEKECSFVAEYRVDGGGFDNTKCCMIVQKCNACLIMLGGGRRIEAMRIHDLSKPQPIHRVCNIICGNPLLAMDYDAGIRKEELMVFSNIV